MFTCSECGTEFETMQKCMSHEAQHKVLQSKRNPNCFLVQLPEGVKPGGWDAFEAFSEGFAELEARIGGRAYQFAETSSEECEGEIEVTAYFVNVAPESQRQPDQTKATTRRTRAARLPSLEQLLQTSQTKIAVRNLRRYLATLAKAAIKSTRELLVEDGERLLRLGIPPKAWKRVAKRLRSAGSPHGSLEGALAERRRER